MSDLSVKRISNVPAPLWIIRLGETSITREPPFNSTKLLMRIKGNLLACTFRSVNMNQLPVVLRRGIDVAPKNSVFFASHFGTAWEYGGSPKLMLALDTTKLERSFKEIPADTPSNKVQQLRKTYPTLSKRKGGKTLWFSRLPETDSRIGSASEINNAWWMKRDPFEVLKGILLFAALDDEDTTFNLIESLKGRFSFVG